MKKLACVLAIPFFLLACGGDSGGSGGGDGGGPDGGMGQPDAFVPPDDSYSLTWGPLSIPAGQESTKCVIKRLDNPTSIRVHQIHNNLGGISHHFIVYRTNDTQERPDPFDCQPFADTLDPAAGSPIMITQKAEETLTLPDGVAFTFEANQMIRLELHYVNAGTEPIDATATATFLPMAESEFENEADFLFIGDIDISLPPGQASTVGPTYFPLPTELLNTSIFAITGHTHELGTDVFVARSPNGSTEDLAVYDVAAFNWDEPDTVYHDPPFTVPQGGFRFRCEYNNTTDQTVTFGESANDEMCFFWAYYYPSQGARVCIQTDQFGGQTACCPGTHPICSFL